MKFFALLSLVAGLFALTGCDEDPPDVLSENAHISRDAQILMIGDSVLWWNSDDEASVGDVLEVRLGQSATNQSIPGAQFKLDGENSIQRQYVAGPWQWVVMNGGANDLGECGCGFCMRAVDRLINDNILGGQIPAYVRGLLRKDHRVVLVGYYNVVGNGEFSNCDDEVDALNARLKIFALWTDGVEYAHTADLLLTPADFDPDRVHPSVGGSDKIGRRIADVINAAR